MSCVPIPNSSLPLNMLFLAVCRRKWVVVSVFAMGLSLAAIISYLAPDHYFSNRDSMVFLLLSGDVFLVAGVIIALILERLDGVFHSAAQLENKLGCACLAAIPCIDVESDEELSKSMLVPLLDVVRGKKENVVTFTSSLPGEGKTTLALSLARVAAEDQKVILVDANLQTPHLHDAVQESNELTLVDYLTDRAALEEVIQKNDASGVHMIYGCSVPNTASDLIGSDKMRKLVKALGKAYDLVILDSPACLFVSDACALAGISNHVFYTVASGCTSCEDVASGAEQLHDIDTVEVSFMLNKVDAD